MRAVSPLRRSIAVAVLVSVALAGASGCRWLRKSDDAYKQSAENRPLEVPPDLDRPDTQGAMALPGGQSVMRSTMAAAPAAGTSSGAGFTVPGERDAVFNRIGEVLASTAGVTVASKAQILGTYDVDYEGTKFLVRVTKVDAGVYVSAVDPRGMPASGEAPGKLIAALKAGLGG